MLERYLSPHVKADLARKMVFLGGPRQVGKTTLAKSLLKTSKEGYLNWDAAADRERLLRGELPAAPLWALDELHKYRGWRNFLKGLCDGRRPGQKILVAGSARLDYYRFGGDSLQGRYHYLRLHPLSAAELKMSKDAELRELLERGGFPEPFFARSAVEAKRWSREYRTRLLREDLSSLEHVPDIGTLELLMLRLPELVGSPLSLNALREDLRVSHKTVSRWMDLLERLYAVFRLAPLGSSRIRAVLKERKHYHFDWTLIAEPGLRFENLVACHLLKWAHYRVDAFGENAELRYFRDVDGREVDFILTEDGKPAVMVECKWSDAEVSPSLRYLKAKFPRVPAWQVSAAGTKDYVTSDGIRVCPALRLLKDLV